MRNNNLPTTHAYLNTPRLSLFGIRSFAFSNTQTNAHTHKYKPIFHPNIHGGKSLSSSTSHSLLQLSQALFPLQSQCCHWNLLIFLANTDQVAVIAHSAPFDFWPSLSPVAFFSWNNLVQANVTILISQHWARQSMLALCGTGVLGYILYNAAKIKNCRFNYCA